MQSAHSEINGAESLVGIFGYWPHFHDAEVLSFNLSRGELNAEEDSWVFPFIQSRIHVFEMTSEVTSTGHFVLAKHHLVTFRFDGVDDLHLEGFNHQNVLMGLQITRLPDGPQRFEVNFDSAFGADARFTCSQISISEIQPCNEKGSPCA